MNRNTITNTTTTSSPQAIKNDFKVNDSINSSLTSEIEMNLICGEYLKYANYNTTLHEFENECKKRGLYHDFLKESNSQDDMDKDKKNEVYNLLLNSFHQGDRTGFMETWLKALSPSTRQTDAVAQNLEFNLQVYFAIFPIHDYVDVTQAKAWDINVTMMEFKKYLEKNSTKLSQSQQYIPFYALPYVPDPKSHTLFRETFTEQWILSLEDELKSFMNSMLNTSPKPRLYSLILEGNKTEKQDRSKEYIEEIEDYKNQILSYKSNEEVWDKKYSIIKNDYGNLVSLTSELVKLLTASLNGEQISKTFLNDIAHQVSLFEQKNVEEYGNPNTLIPIDKNFLLSEGNEISRDMTVNSMQMTSLPNKSTSLYKNNDPTIINNNQNNNNNNNNNNNSNNNINNNNNINENGNIIENDNSSISSKTYTMNSVSHQKLPLDHDYPLPVNQDLKKSSLYPNDHPLSNLNSNFNPNPNLNSNQNSNLNPRINSGHPSEQSLPPLGTMGMGMDMNMNMNMNMNMGNGMGMTMENNYYDFDSSNRDRCHFNYKAIISDLKSEMNDQNLVKLIQALRLNLARVYSNKKRREILSTYIQNDILDIKGKSSTNVISRLLNYSSEVVHLQLFKFLNVISTDSIGREYLLNGWPKIIENLITILFSFKTFTDSIFYKNILAVLQKLSLRRKAQSIMIKENLIEFIIEFLSSNESSNNFISEETLEYCIALLMNLSLRTDGKKKCGHRSKELLKILNNYIEHDNQQIKTYINGTLYNLFTEHVIREQAKSMGMNDLLEYLLSISDIQLKRQIEFVLEQLNSDEVIDNSDLVSEDGDEDDQDDENDNDIPELDENLIINDLAEEDGNEEFGYDLLCKKYPSPIPIPAQPSQSQSQTLTRKEDYPIIPSSLSINPKPVIKPIQPISPEKEYVKNEVFKRTNVARLKNINPIMVNNKPMVTDFGNKSYNNEMNPLRNNNTMVGNSLTSNNYKMNTNSFPKDSQLTPLRTQNKNQTTPIIIKRHSRKPTAEDYIKRQTIKPHPPLTSVMKKVKDKTGMMNNDEELKEFYQAFTSKPRIARTPVESISHSSRSTLPEIRPNSTTSH
jgi:hypothetical protein